MANITASLDENSEDVPQNMLALKKCQNICYEADIRKRNTAASVSSEVIAGPDVDTYNWQSKHGTLMERLRFLLFNTVMSDVTFVVGSQREHLPAHKCVLSFGSAVFEAMFFRMLATSSNEIELPDVEPSAFRNLLHFLYTDTVFLEADTVMTTLYSAKKYAVPALEKQCVEFLESHLCSDNAFLLLSQAMLFDETKLILLCLDTIEKNTQECLNAEGFLDIDIETLHSLLENNALRIREIRLYEAVLSWADNKCEKHDWEINAENRCRALRNCLQLIRYPLMTIAEFAAGPAQSGLLTDAEVVQLFLYFTLNPKPVPKFSDAPRCCMTGPETIAHRFSAVESRWGYNGTSDKIRFQVNRRIFVTGFGLYGSIRVPSDYDVVIQIIHSHSTNLVGSNKTRFNSDGTRHTFRVMFKDPIEIMPHISYIATATIIGADSYYGTNGNCQLTQHCNGEKVIFQFSYAENSNGTSAEDGQIPEIIFHT